MRYSDLARKIEGVQTVESVKDALDVNRKKAIYYLHRLRKQGYVKTKRLSNNKRVYEISFENRLGGKSYYEIINQHSPVKLAEPYTYRLYGKPPSLEETMIFAIKTKSLRTILASLALFKDIHDWTHLYALAKENKVERQVGALYDLTRTIMKTRRMTNRFRNNAIQKNDRFQYLIEGLKSKDFPDIEKTWKVYIPFNKADLEEYL